MAKLCKWVWLFILIGCVGLNLLTLTRSPTVWMDEVSYADPGIRLANGEGFTSSIWYSQNEETFFAGNVPLHPFLLSGWVSVFGDSCFAVRSFNIFLMAIVTLLIYGLLRKLTQSYVASWMGMLLMWSLQGILFSYRSARPDIEVFILGVLLLFGLFEAKKTTRFSLLAISSFLMPFAGIQGLPWLALLFIFAYAFSRYVCQTNESLGTWILKGVLIGGCAILGLIVLLCVYRHFGVLEIFMQATFGMHSVAASQGLLSRIFETFLQTKRLFAYPFLLLLVCAVGLIGKQEKAWYCLLLLVCAMIPYALAFLGKYPIYYHFMGDFPLVVVVCMAFARCETRIRKVVVVCVVGILCLGGLGARSTMAVLEWQSRDQTPVNQFVAKHIPANSVVGMTWQTYYAVRGITSKCYIPEAETFAEGMRQPSVHSEKVMYLTVDQKNVPAVDTNKWELVATYDAGDGLRKGGASKYAFAIFRRK